MGKLNGIVSSVLGIDIEKVTPELSRENTEEWDSFNHLLLISEIEKIMGIKFSMQEVEQIKTFEQLEEMILRKRT